MKHGISLPLQADQVQGSLAPLPKDLEDQESKAGRRTPEDKEDNEKYRPSGSQSIVVSSQPVCTLSFR